MKYFLRSLFALIVLLGMVSCAKEVAPEITISGTSSTYEVGYARNSSVTVSFTCTTDWSIASVPQDLDISTTQGGKGNQQLTVRVKNANESNAEKKYSFTITGKGKESSVSKTITLNQLSAFVLPQQNFSIEAKGGVAEVNFTLNSKENYTASTLKIMIRHDQTFREMWVATASEKSDNQTRELRPTRSSDWSVEFEITENKSESSRVGLCCLALIEKGDTICSDFITITQKGVKTAESTDYSEDGKTFTLQTHSKGEGIPVVLMGDGFLDKDIKTGVYEKTMKQTCSYLFTAEPVKSLKEYFDVYYVNAVSETNSFAEGKTVFASKFEGGTSTGISGDDKKAMDYADKVEGISGLRNASESEKFRHNNALVVIVLNDARYAGTCAIYSDGVEREIPRGYSVAYIPMADSSKHDGIGFEQILHHEALGHGFGKLADEYAYEKNGTLKEESEEYGVLKSWQSYGCYKNVDTTDKLKDTFWAHLAAESCYAAEKIGCYEGGYTYSKGVYRPTETSIMVSNDQGFNAPSRELIYKRAMMIAGGGTYTYVFEDFLAFDEPSWKMSSAAETRVAIPWKQPQFWRPLGKPRLKLMPK